MVRLTQRGNQVGFSGGNIMRMDVSYFDLVRQPRSRHTADPEPGLRDRRQSAPRASRQPDRAARHDPAAPSGSTLRLSLTLYEIEQRQGPVDGDRSCSVWSSAAMQAGMSIVNHIFDNADANRVADAGCPL